MFDIKSPATFLKYLYVIDMGLYTENSVSVTDNIGRRLENLIFLHLRRKHKHIFYYKDKGECDFIVMEKNTVKQAIQVCLTINDENFDREYNGLLGAKQNLGLKEGYVITLNQSDIFEKDDMVIKMIPASVFFI